MARNARRQETHKIKRRQHRLSVVSAEGRSVTDDTGGGGGGGGVADGQSPPLCHSPLQLLSDEHSNLIALLVAYQDKYDLPTADDIRKVSVCLSLRLSLFVCMSVCLCCMSVCLYLSIYLSYHQCYGWTMCTLVHYITGLHGPGRARPGNQII